MFELKKVNDHKSQIIKRREKEDDTEKYTSSSQTRDYVPSS